MLHDFGQINLRTFLALMTNDLHESTRRTYSGSSPAKSSASSYRKPGIITRMACFWTLSNIFLKY